MNRNNFNVKNANDIDKTLQNKLKKNNSFSLSSIIETLFFNPFRIIAIFFVLALIIILIYLFVLGGFSSLFFNKNTPFFVKNAQTKNSAYLLKSINNLSELSTTEMVFSKVIETKINFNNLELPGGISFSRESSQKVNIEGSVKAGINLSEIKESDIVVNSNNEVSINLPKPIITNVSLNEESNKIIDDSNSLVLSIETLIPTKKLEVQNALKNEIAKQSKKQIVEAACKEDIFSKSQDRSEKIVTSIFENSEFDKVTINKQVGDNCGVS